MCRPERQNRKHGEGEESERRQKRKKKKKSPGSSSKAESTALDPASPKKCCQSKEAERCPTSCVGLVPELGTANVNPLPTLVYAGRDAQMCMHTFVLEGRSNLHSCPDFNLMLILQLP